ncbi:DUF7657 domain-containing protein [Bifidobacterium vespertilionis]|uniref:Uncharacterized protein n=1 Tax=Bifidobacterium vespertilionis TaxID=2562524 RepID=A0A5J5DV70_9BIFI|nr:hypothetical protein [Bifidobacterium vespertilionis]KAA8819005.1 hypothetical protein EMO90_08595 [Bifidobacterium vespertilionis]KAA8820238.1 hypothetical protein EM848_11880 [Bifidobacterium vespertilionis]
MIATTLTTSQRSVARATHTVFAVCVALLCALYVECFLQAVAAARSGADRTAVWFVDFSRPSSLWRIAIIWMAFAAALCLLTSDHAPIRAFRRSLHRWRWPMGGLMIAILTAAGISGFSVAEWSSLAGGEPFQGVLWGVPRGIRSDEWVVFTPFAFSQSHTGYDPVSSVIRAWPTDVTMLYAQPAWALATLFRLFLWGFMLLGSAHGLAFFWSARLIVLLLVSYEFGRLITRDDRWLAAGYAMMVGFAPIVQWWFAVNGIAELFIFGQALVVLFDRYLAATGAACVSSSTGARWRWVLAAGLAYCAGGYALILYPAWQIPMCYVFAACGAAVLIGRLRGFDRHGLRARFRVRDFAPMIVAAVALIGVLAFVFLRAWDTVSAVMHTAYPGARSETGGGLLNTLFNYVASPFSALDDAIPMPNASEQSTFYGLFPLGIVLGVLGLRRRRDPWIIALLAVDALLLAFGLVGFPSWLAKITMFSSLTVDRIKLATTFIDLLLLTRLASRHPERSAQADSPCRPDERSPQAGSPRHPERSAQRVVEGSLTVLPMTQYEMTKDPSTPLRFAQDDKKRSPRHPERSPKGAAEGSLIPRTMTLREMTKGPSTPLRCAQDDRGSRPVAQDDGGDRRSAQDAAKGFILAALFAGAALSCNIALSGQRRDGTQLALMAGFALLTAFAFIVAIVWPKRLGSRMIALAAVLMMLSGLCVNPVQQGARALTDNPAANLVASSLRSAGENTADVRLVTDNPFLGQAMIANGIPTITSVNPVPALERWATVDPDGKYRDVYNRYAYVQIDVENDGRGAWFELHDGQPDYVVAHLAPADLKAIGATHVLTTRDLVPLSGADVQFAPIGSSDGLTLYRVE